MFAFTRDTPGQLTIRALIFSVTIRMLLSTSGGSSTLCAKMSSPGVLTTCPVGTKYIVMMSAGSSIHRIVTVCLFM